MSCLKMNRGTTGPRTAVHRRDGNRGSRRALGPPLWVSGARPQVRKVQPQLLQRRSNLRPNPTTRPISVLHQPNDHSSNALCPLTNQPFCPSLPVFRSLHHADSRPTISPIDWRRRVGGQDDEDGESAHTRPEMGQAHSQGWSCPPAPLKHRLTWPRISLRPIMFSCQTPPNPLERAMSLPCAMAGEPRSMSTTLSRTSLHRLAPRFQRGH